ncbi:glutamyl-tRNA(Gln) amidotransferase subunit B, mitochondrial isoform X2 [Bombus vancouverensis nearcticus]|uniref:glutamyl-tRNA(Gln) amidotransferase subunit B, mitochondrial isoform X2 n=1 Tax=Bombus vancouverensis nearcticus TaxID=2705178 RepID=UPI00143B9038|nr:glutamyl-tRNA(Gln) amidotransferase subunit B, mitochondrial isoform X2 [Bombus vancouverensis nearcticus]
MLIYRRISNFIKKYYKNTYRKFCVRFISTNLEWKPSVGLEIHAQISTESKLFSGSPTSFNHSVNSCVSLFDCAVPGTMPVLNKKCVEAGVLTALALSCEVNAVSMFERKHYFYSDLPAGFQITQQRKPLAVNGEIKFNVFKSGLHKKSYSKSSKIKQIQLEQDSGRSLHNEVFGRSLIDLNRAGIPLMEFVFEPDLTNGEEAAALVQELCLILQLLGTCSCKMQEGALRVDANVSVSKPNAPLGVRTELKNIGSISALNHAVEYEIKRQISILQKGGQVINETRAWNPINKNTILMREKEDKHDYRFMPEPNLPPLYLHIKRNVQNKYNLIDVPSLKEQLPELPEQIRKNLLQGLTPDTLVAVTSNFDLFLLFCDILKNGKHRDPQLVAKLFISDVLSFMDDYNLNLTFCVNNQEYIEELMDLIQAEVINRRTLRKLLNELVNKPNKMPKQIVEENKWFIISDEKELELICSEILKANPELVKKYKAGKRKIYKKFLHKAAILTEDRADMAKVSKIMTRLLS